MKHKPMVISTSTNLAEVFIGYKTKLKTSELPILSSSLEVVEVLRNIFNEDKIEHIEEFIILLLNRANKVLGWAKISIGGVSGCVVDCKVVFQLAIKTNASSIILSHNHPSGNVEPSQADLNLTTKLRAGGLLLDINVLDHIIITKDEYKSFADEGLM